MLINDWGDKDEAQEPTLDREFLSSLKDIKVSTYLLKQKKKTIQQGNIKICNKILAKNAVFLLLNAQKKK